MKNRRPAWWFLLVVLILGATGYGIWRQPAKQMAAAGRQVRFYQDSMHPWIKSDQPGKCTICGMALTPVYEGDVGFSAGGDVVALSPTSITVLQVQTAEVQRRPLTCSLRVAGTLEADETRKAIVAAPARGRVMSVVVDYPGAEVEAGQLLVTLFSPELQQQRRYLTASRRVTIKSSPPAATPAEAEADLYTGEINATQSGTVIARTVYNGQYVAEGDSLFTIVDTSRLWFRFDDYERQLPWIAPGQAMTVTVPAWPGRIFPATVAFIEPALDDTARTVKVRADLANPEEKSGQHTRRPLQIGMYAEARVTMNLPGVLVVPRTAVLYPGRTAYVYRQTSPGAYERRQVRLGRQGDTGWEVLDGLAEGDRVVTTGNVLIDAQAQINQGNIPEETASSPGEPAMTACPAPPVAEPPAPTAPLTDAQRATAAVQAYRDSDRTRLARSQEMRQVRRATLAAAHEGKTADGMPMTTPAVAPVVPIPTSNTPPTTNDVTAAKAGVQAYRRGDYSRMALSEDMRLVRRVAIAKANGVDTNKMFPLTAEQRDSVDEVLAKSAAMPGQPAPAVATVLPHAAVAPATTAPPLTAVQRQALTTFLGVADSLGQALANDALGQFNQHLTRLPDALTALENAFAEGHCWHEAVQRLAALSRKTPANDLAGARQIYLPFSTATVELAGPLRRADPAFAGLKIYHCPMAPKPGLWLQVAGPLHNPYFGAAMPTCGEEVKLR